MQSGRPVVNGRTEWSMLYLSIKKKIKKTKIFLHNCTNASEWNWKRSLMRKRASRHDHKMREKPNNCHYKFIFRSSWISVSSKSRNLSNRQHITAWLENFIFRLSNLDFENCAHMCSCKCNYYFLLIFCSIWRFRIFWCEYGNGHF